MQKRRRLGWVRSAGRQPFRERSTPAERKPTVPTPIPGRWASAPSRRAPLARAGGLGTFTEFARGRFGELLRGSRHGASGGRRQNDRLPFAGHRFVLGTPSPPAAAPLRSGISVLRSVASPAPGIGEVEQSVPVGSRPRAGRRRARRPGRTPRSVIPTPASMQRGGRVPWLLRSDPDERVVHRRAPAHAQEAVQGAARPWAAGEGARRERSRGARADARDRSPKIEPGNSKVRQGRKTVQTDGSRDLGRRAACASFFRRSSSQLELGAFQELQLFLAAAGAARPCSSEQAVPIWPVRDTSGGNVVDRHRPTGSAASFRRVGSLGREGDRALTKTELKGSRETDRQLARRIAGAAVPCRSEAMSRAAAGRKRLGAVSQHRVGRFAMARLRKGPRRLADSGKRKQGPPAAVSAHPAPERRLATVEIERSRRGPAEVSRDGVPTSLSPTMTVGRKRALDAAGGQHDTTVTDEEARSDTVVTSCASKPSAGPVPSQAREGKTMEAKTKACQTSEEERSTWFFIHFAECSAPNAQRKELVVVPTEPERRSLSPPASAEPRAALRDGRTPENPPPRESPGVVPSAEKGARWYPTVGCGRPPVLESRVGKSLTTSSEVGADFEARMRNTAQREDRDFKESQSSTSTCNFMGRKGSFGFGQESLPRGKGDRSSLPSPHDNRPPQMPRGGTNSVVIRPGAAASDVRNGPARRVERQLAVRPAARGIPRPAAATSRHRAGAEQAGQSSTRAPVGFRDVRAGKGAADGGR
ncbi:hypothetical protein DFJ74DRAFT_726265 [Hyaloraphidium curvatum]|nr:hypothetical protein DFJ74DRAFT_726265 [Hyaloraphidium curvatum]